jgi:hypothetical protein
MQPLKERLLREVGYGLALEGASASALVKQFRAAAAAQAAAAEPAAAGHGG